MCSSPKFLLDFRVHLRRWQPQEISRQRHGLLRRWELHHLVGRDCGTPTWISDRASPLGSSPWRPQLTDYQDYCQRTWGGFWEWIGYGIWQRQARREFSEAVVLVWVFCWVTSPCGRFTNLSPGLPSFRPRNVCSRCLLWYSPQTTVLIIISWKKLTFRMYNNMFGTKDFHPVALKSLISDSAQIKEYLNSRTSEFSLSIKERAANYIRYVETKSTFEIEDESGKSTYLSLFIWFQYILTEKVPRKHGADFCVMCKTSPLILRPVPGRSHRPYFPIKSP